MASFVKFYSFAEAVAEKRHNLGADTLKIVLSNTAPNASTHTQLSDITQIANGNGYTTGGEALTITSSSQTGGVYSLVITSNIVWTATGAVGPFQYVVLYNDTATNDELLGYWDYGSTVSLTTGNTFTANLAAQTIISIS